MKRISVLVVGSGQIHDLSLKEGTTCQDILNEVGLQDYYLSKQNEPHPFNPDDNVYTVVVEGEKLNAATEMSVGRLGAVNLK